MIPTDECFALTEQGWSRRRFLQTGGVVAVGAVAVGAIAVGIEATGCETGASTARLRRAPRPPVTRRKYRSRPDLTSAPIAVGNPLARSPPASSS